MTLNIDTVYLHLDNSQYARLRYIASYKNTFSYTNTFKSSNAKSFDFTYTLSIYEIDGFSFKVKQFKRGTYRLELYGLHQYTRNNKLKTNDTLKKLFPSLKHAYIKRLDLCTDSKHKPQTKKLKTKKLKNYKGTIYHNLYNKNYFSSYIYNKQLKNNLSTILWRSEYSFRTILRSKKWRFQLKDLNKLIKRCERFVNNLEQRANSLNV